MSALELLAILILAGAIIVLLYYYLMESVNGRTRLKSQVYGVTQRSREKGERMSVSKKMSGVGDKIIHKVREVPISADVISSKIDAFLEEKSDELIRDWELATKNDIKNLQNRLNLVSRNIGELERRFNEYRGYTNKKLEFLEKRLKELEKKIE